MKRLLAHFALVLTALGGLLTASAGPASAATDSAIINAGDGLCLEIPGNPATTSYGTRSEQWGCNGGTNQQWYVWF